MSDEQSRWQHRFSSFDKALSLLREALEDKPLEAYSRLEQEGIVQRFEYTFELAWKTMRICFSSRVSTKRRRAASFAEPSRLAGSLRKMQCSGSTLSESAIFSVTPTMNGWRKRRSC